MSGIAIFGRPPAARVIMVEHSRQWHDLALLRRCIVHSRN